MHALAVPTGVVSAQDTTTIQLLEILSSLVDEVVTESKFNVTTLEATFTTVASMDQGAVTDLATDGYQWIINDTLFDRTLARKVVGPVTEGEWQSIQALPDPGPLYKYRLRGGHLWLAPAPSGTMSDMAFEYVSSWAVVSAAGTAKATVTVDDDGFVFPENILKRGLAFRWKQIKGLAYQADEAAYYDLLNKFIGREKTARQIDVGTPCPGIRPGIFVPSGNWNQ